jgi:predicted N-acetyltransferase YhbS
MPDPVPVVLLGRLAIDRVWQGRGLGADPLRDAVLRAMSAGEAIGVRAILVRAVSGEATVCTFCAPRTTGLSSHGIR